MAKKPQPTYRELQDKLDAVVARLEDPSIDIDEATAAHKEGLALVKQLQAYLQQAENSIAKAQADFTAQ